VLAQLPTKQLFRRQSNAKLHDIVDVSVRSQEEPTLGDTASYHERLAWDNLARGSHTLVVGRSVEMSLTRNEKLQPVTFSLTPRGQSHLVE